MTVYDLAKKRRIPGCVIRIAFQE